MSEKYPYFNNRTIAAKLNNMSQIAKLANQTRTIEQIASELGLSKTYVSHLIELIEGISRKSYGGDGG